MCSGNGIRHWITHSRSRSPIRPLPVDSPASACHRNPEQFLQWCCTGMVVEHGGALVEPASVPRVNKAELLEVEIMAELVAEGAQKRAERSDFLPHCRSHPYRWWVVWPYDEILSASDRNSFFCFRSVRPGTSHRQAAAWLFPHNSDMESR
jgi:hypothetical protein